MGTPSPRANRPSRPSTFLTARLDSLIQTSSCLWFLFSTSETEAEPLVWSWNKLELKLPLQGNWERCTVSAEAVAQGNARGGVALPAGLGNRKPEFWEPGVRDAWLWLGTTRVLKRCLMD